MVKKISAVLLTTIILASLFGTVLVFAADDEPRLVVTSATAMPGDTVVLSVKLENNPGINSFSLGFDYDTSRLELKKVKVSSNLGGQFAYKTRAVWVSGKDTKYNGEILSLTFKVLDKAENGTAKVSVSYLPGEISNYNEDDVNFTVVPGQVNVGISESMVSKIILLLKQILKVLRKMFGV